MGGASMRDSAVFLVITATIYWLEKEIWMIGRGNRGLESSFTIEKEISHYTVVREGCVQYNNQRLV